MPSIPNTPLKLSPSYPSALESPSTTSLIQTLRLEPHVEGGYFAEIDRNPLRVVNPFLPSTSPQTSLLASADADADTTRSASTSIFYLLTPSSPQGCFHRNKGRTVHTLIQGRGVYVLIHGDEAGEKKRVESFVVGRGLERGERAVWVVEGGKYKGSFLLEGGGLLISETVIPGFEYADHDFLTEEKFRTLVTAEQAEELGWLVRKA